VRPPPPESHPHDTPTPRASTTAAGRVDSILAGRKGSGSGRVLPLARARVGITQSGSVRLSRSSGRLGFGWGGSAQLALTPVAHAKRLPPPLLLFLAAPPHQEGVGADGCWVRSTTAAVHAREGGGRHQSRRGRVGGLVAGS
jgi:hypothetical protein